MYESSDTNIGDFCLQGCRLTEDGLADTLIGIARKFPRVPGLAVPSNGERQLAAC